MSNPETNQPQVVLSWGLTLLVGGLFILAGLTGVLGLVVSAMPLPKPSWNLFGFESVITMSAALGVMYCRKACIPAPAVGLACLAGCIAVGSALGCLSTRQVGGVSTLPFAVGRLILAAAIGGIAVIAAMDGDRRRWITLVKGVVLGIPVIAAGGVLVFPQGQRLAAALSGLGGTVAFLLGCLIFLVLTGLASASIHLVIRAFDRADSPGRASPTKPSPP